MAGRQTTALAWSRAAVCGRAAIGTRWGFVSPSHFSRVFRGAFGQSPTEYRAAAMSRLGS
jgi:transcriptional regulator GlxA family with amidase domain